MAFNLSIFTTLSRPFANFWRRYPKGIDNPFNTSGCEYLLFVCRCCLRGVKRFSYWFDNLDLITEGNTCHRYTASFLPLWGNNDVVLADITETDCMNSMRPISEKIKQRVGQPNSMGSIVHFGETEIITTGNSAFARPSR